MTEDTFTCSVCEEVKPVNKSGGIGYALTRETDAKLCYACCGQEDETTMKAEGKHVLYLTKDAAGWKITNWPGSLVIRPTRVQTSKTHAFGNRIERSDAWFTFDGSVWHGINKGDNELLRVKRTKQPA